MSNAFLTAKEYANAMLLLLTNNLVYGGLVDGSLENKVTDQNGLKVYKKRPPRFAGGTGALLTPKISSWAKSRSRRPIQTRPPFGRRP
ncbi:MAG: hypothetical protein HC888_04655 [Candidatus Competibacteraceae bacterium]|nr:hypothetical protein [Candidatus Competibacteraceae bacterium]